MIYDPVQYTRTITVCGDWPASASDGQLLFMAGQKIALLQCEVWRLEKQIEKLRRKTGDQEEGEGE